MKAPISADERKRTKLSWQPKILAKINKAGQEQQQQQQQQARRTQ